jgi:hypothetical protein
MIRHSKCILIARAVAVLIFTFLAQSCAHQKIDRQVEEKLQNSAPVQDSAQIGLDLQKSFAQNPNLSIEQRDKLAAMQRKLHSDLGEFRSQSLQVRSALAKDVSNPVYNPDEIESLKIRLRKIENKRLSAIFKAVDQTNKILGRDMPDKLRAMQELFEMHDRTY